jgi:hypothetical protein
LIQTVEFDFFSQVVHEKTDIEALQTREEEGGFHSCKQRNEPALQLTSTKKDRRPNPPLTAHSRASHTIT